MTVTPAMCMTPEQRELVIFRSAVLAAMKTHRWTLRQLAKAAGYHVSTLSRMLHSDPTTYRLRPTLKLRVLTTMGDHCNYDSCPTCSGTGRLAKR